MQLPQFTAQASLERARKNYASLFSRATQAVPAGRVAAALWRMPRDPLGYCPPTCYWACDDYGSNCRCLCMQSQY